jgi:5-formyltetrahydrofolate cyclo-ligase
MTNQQPITHNQQLTTHNQQPTTNNQQQITNNKYKLRRQLLKQRKALSDSEWRNKSKAICQQLETIPLFQNARTILAYSSFRREPDLALLYQTQRKVWGFPRCVDKSLLWHRWQPSEGLQKGAYGIFEPHPDCERLEAQDVDLILVPAVACDRDGYRLGYGGGYYDRMLSLPEWFSMPTIGIIFEFAFLQHLPREEWDKPLWGVCTETKWRQTNS